MAKFLIVLILMAQMAGAANLDKDFAKTKVKLGAHEITVYIADTEAKRSQGLMFVEKLPTDVGMLFVFESEQPLNFWMKNTLIPLNIGFFDAHGVLVDAQEMKVASSLMSLTPPTYASRAPAALALEMNQGWFAKHNLKNGVRMALISNSTSALLNQRLKKDKIPGR